MAYFMARKQLFRLTAKMRSQSLCELDHATDLDDADIVVEDVEPAIGLQAGRDHRLDLGRRARRRR